MKWLAFLALLISPVKVLWAQCSYTFTLNVASTSPTVDNTVSQCSNFTLTYSITNAVKAIVTLDTSRNGKVFTSTEVIGSTTSVSGIYNYLRVNVIYLQGNDQGNGPSITLHLSGTAPISAGSVYYSYVDNEVPVGTVDGVSNRFALSQPPSGSSLILTRNGLIQQLSGDYTLSGNIITFSPVSIPQAGDNLQAWYRIAAANSAAYHFSDAEQPVGVQDTTNTTFTLTYAPSPTASLILSRNGIVQKSGVDFTLSSNIITFLQGSIPSGNDIIQAWYRY